MLAAVALVIGALGLGACGSSTSSSSATTSPSASIDLRAVMERTIAISSATSDFTMAVSSGGQQAKMRLVGSVDFVANTGAGESSGGDVSFEFRVTPQRSWLRSNSPQLAAALPPGTQWVEAPTDLLVQRGVLSLTPEVNWAAFYFLAGAEDVQKLGDGAYSFVVDLDAMDDALTADQRRAMRATIADFADPDIVTSVRGTVRIDDAGRAVDLRVEIEVEAPDGTRATATLEMTATNIGAPVTVEAPPAEQVATVEANPELLRLLGGPGPGY